MNVCTYLHLWSGFPENPVWLCILSKPAHLQHCPLLPTNILKICEEFNLKFKNFKEWWKRDYKIKGKIAKK